MSTDQDVDEATYDETLGTALTLDDREEVLSPFFVPRLAAYASSKSPPTSFVSSEGIAEEDQVVSLPGRSEGCQLSVRDSGERSAVHLPEDDASEGVALHIIRGQSALCSVSADEEDQGNVKFAVDPFLTQTDGEDVDDGFEAVEHDEDEEGEEGAVSAEASQDTSSGNQGGDSGSVSTYLSAFAHSRVKELLKYEGSSAIISKDATAAACEAVALLMRDLVKMAAAEATRRHRKTVTYEDVARVVQLLDRFSFLSEVVPPVTTSSSGSLRAGKPIVVGSQKHSPAMSGKIDITKPHGEPLVRSRSVHSRSGGDVAVDTHQSPPVAARSTVPHARVSGAAGQRSALHPQPGSGLRQATLRF